MKTLFVMFLGLAVCLSSLACGTAGKATGGDRMTLGQSAHSLTTAELKARRDRYASVQITVDEARISAEDRAVLVWLVRAAAVMDRLFWKQASNTGLAVRAEIADLQGERGEVLRDYVDINYGVYDRLEEDEPFYGTSRRPSGATFYPEDMTKSAFSAWIEAHPEDKEAFLSPFTIIRKDDRGQLTAVPYSTAWRHDLEEAADYLRKAAMRTGDKALKTFLNSRADAFLSNDYFQSDMDWMDLGTGGEKGGSAIDVTISPYEVYEDKLMNLKAAFEAFVTIVDREESRKLSLVARYLDELEANLPVDDRHKNFSRGKSSPISVVNVVFTAGDTRAGVQTTAFNLPNDERVRTAKGSKKVMLKNVGEAKFNKSLIPIARTLVDPELTQRIDFEAYFNDILMHEMSHGLGPGVIALPDGTKTTVNLALKETYSAIEECKADVLGVHNTLYLVSRGIFPADLRPRTEATSLAGIFRSVRFGVEEAHGKANIVEFNFLREEGAYTFDPATGRFGVNSSKFPDAIRKLARRLLTIQGEGDYEGAKTLLDRYGQMTDEVDAALGRLAHVPVDIRPIYTLGEKLLNEAAR